MCSPGCNSRRFRKGTARGFSLIELVFVVAVAVVLLAISIPHIKEALRKYL